MTTPTTPTTPEPVSDARMSEVTDVYLVVGTEQAGGIEMTHRLVRTMDVQQIRDLMHKLRAR